MPLGDVASHYIHERLMSLILDVNVRRRVIIVIHANIDAEEYEMTGMARCS